MASVTEKIVSATEFKAKCLELMDQLDAGKLSRVLITKRGRVVSMAVPPPTAEKPRLGFAAIHGSMKGMSGIPEDFDWEKPLFSKDELAEQDRRFAEKFKDHL